MRFGIALAEHRSHANNNTQGVSVSTVSYTHLINFRENTEDCYAAIEHMVSDEVAQCLKVITWPGSYRIADFAFQWARANGRKKVYCCLLYTSRCV